MVRDMNWWELWITLWVTESCLRQGPDGCAIYFPYTVLYYMRLI